jgi:hypothetical protein
MSQSSPPPPSRRLRHFRPMTGALEGRVPVSSLFPGTSPASPPSPARVEGAENRGHRPNEQGGAERGLSVELAPPGSAVVVSATTSGWSTTSSTTAGAGAPRPGAWRPVTAELASIRTLPPSVPAAGTPEGGPALAPPIARQPQARGAAVDASSPGAAPSSQPPAPTARGGEIRALSMAPPNPGAASALSAAVASAANAPHGGQAVAYSLGGSKTRSVSSMEESGGGGNNTNVNPLVSLSGGGAGASGTGSVSMQTPISIGATVVVSVSAPGGSGETLQTVTITGMSSISSYFNTAPNATAPENMSLGQAVNTRPTPNGDGVAGTTFIVDASPRAYSIDVNVTYVGGDTGETVITFNSKAPTGTLMMIGQGSTRLTVQGTGLQYRNPNDQQNPDGITIQATTAPISYQANGSTAYITGNFMFMQTANASNSYTNTAGQTFVQNSPTSAPSIDNGVPNNGGGELGHTATPTGGAPAAGFPVAGGALGGAGWTLPVTQGNPPVTVTTASYIFSDSPSISAPAGINNLASMTVGSTGGNPAVPGGNPETFTMYLMYQAASGGVWVALASVNWGWGGNATSSNGTTLNPASVTQSNGGAANITQPQTGTAAFPTWTASTQTIFTGWKQQP